MKNVGVHSKNLELYEKNSKSSYSSERAVHRRFQNNCFSKLRKINKKNTNTGVSF